MPGYVGAIDQGTTSTRFMIFDESGSVVSSAQDEHRQILPRPGWVEHDPNEIWEKTRRVIGSALAAANLRPSDLDAVGLTNQRETTVVWDRATGDPIGNAIVWQDTRTAELCRSLAGGDADRFRDVTGLPVSTYFSGPKIRWLLDEHHLTARALRGDLMAGTIDSWIGYRLTGRHVTDVTNASRTMLMGLTDLAWNQEIAAEIGVPLEILPEIVSSSGEVARCQGVLDGVPLAGILGDQQAALFGQTCFNTGEVKNTYGTGNFMLLNTGGRPVRSDAGLLTTVACRVGDEPATYALEGSVAVTGALVHWLRDNLGLIAASADVEQLAAAVPDNGDVYFVPAFSGLFAPHWRDDARGVIVGLTRFTNRSHIARAALEATAFQTREILDAMILDSGANLAELKVDGGMVGNEILMQFQSDILGIDVVRPRIAETTALGAAYAAGLAAGLWSGTEELRTLWAEDRRWSPVMGEPERQRLFDRWQQALSRALDWV